MSIYATHWVLRFPRFGDAHDGCDWVTVFGEVVPAHCGPDTAGGLDPFHSFLPPFDTSVAHDVRAFAAVLRGTPKEGQRYLDPLLLISGREYFATSFADLHTRICDRLRGARPRWIGSGPAPNGGVRIMFEDGSSTIVLNPLHPDD